MNMMIWNIGYVMSYGMYHMWIVISFWYDMKMDMIMIHVKYELQYCAIMSSICYCMWDILYMKTIWYWGCMICLEMIMSMSHMA